MIKSVIFDFDGTLCDTMPDVIETVNLMRGRFGYDPVPGEAVIALAGMSTEPFVRLLMPEEFPDSRIDEACAAFSEIYAEHCCEKSVMFDGIRELLMRLKAAGLKLAIMSNKRNEELQLMIEKLIPGVFDEAWGTVEWMPVKPDPTRAKFIAYDFESKPSEVAYVGDSTDDMQTGKNAKMKTYGVAWGYGKPEALIEAGADAIVHSHDELFELLTADDIKQRAEHILNELGLSALLAKYGEPHPIGSYFMDIMCHNDLDIDINNETMTRDKLYELSAEIGKAFRPTWYEAKEEVTEDGRTVWFHGFEAMIDGEKWNFDLWFLDGETIYRAEDTCMLTKLALDAEPEKKAAVRQIKLELISRGLYTSDKFTSQHVYDAVIKRGILTVGDFLQAFGY